MEEKEPIGIGEEKEIEQPEKQPYQFKLLGQEEMDDMLASTLKAQEVDLYMHNINKERYEDMLPRLEEGEFKTRIEELIAETDSRLIEVSNIIESLSKQLPDNTRLNAAIQRVEAKQNASRGE